MPVVKHQFFSNVELESKGTDTTTKVLVDGVEMTGITSIEIDRIEPNSGLIEATIKVSGLRLGKHEVVNIG